MLRVEDFKLPPGRCVICQATQGPAIDLERDITNGPIEGQMYLCAGCIDETTQLLHGDLPYVAELEAEIAQLKVELKTVSEQAVEAEQAREAQASAFELVERALRHEEARTVKKRPGRPRKTPVDAA